MSETAALGRIQTRIALARDAVRPQHRRYFSAAAQKMTMKSACHSSACG